MTEKKLIVVRAYCRGCNREFMVRKETEEDFVEITAFTGELKEHHHPKADCDVLERGIV